MWMQIWSVVDPDWACKIEEGAAGLSYQCWAPDCRHVLTVCDFQVPTVKLIGLMWMLLIVWWYE